MIHFKCPHCGRRISAPAAAAGKVGKCSGCAKAFRAPAVSSGPETATPNYENLIDASALEPPAASESDDYGVVASELTEMSHSRRDAEDDDDEELILDDELDDVDEEEDDDFDDDDDDDDDLDEDDEDLDEDDEDFDEDDEDLEDDLDDEDGDERPAEAKPWVPPWRAMPISHYLFNIAFYMGLAIGCGGIAFLGWWSGGIGGGIVCAVFGFVAVVCFFGAWFMDEDLFAGMQGPSQKTLARLVIVGCDAAPTDDMIREAVVAIGRHRAVSEDVLMRCKVTEVKVGARSKQDFIDRVPEILSQQFSISESDIELLFASNYPGGVMAVGLIYA